MKSKQIRLTLSKPIRTGYKTKLLINTPSLGRQRPKVKTIRQSCSWIYKKETVYTKTKDQPNKLFIKKWSTALSSNFSQQMRTWNQIFSPYLFTSISMRQLMSKRYSIVQDAKRQSYTIQAAQTNHLNGLISSFIKRL